MYMHTGTHTARYLSKLRLGQLSYSPSSSPSSSSCSSSCSSAPTSSPEACAGKCVMRRGKAWGLTKM